MGWPIGWTVPGSPFTGNGVVPLVAAHAWLTHELGWRWPE